MSLPRLSPLLAVLLTGFGGVTAAVAYFGSPGTGTAAAGVATLSAPGSPAATAAAASATVTWTAATINGTVAATSYAVERYSAGGTDLGPATCGTVAASTGQPNALGSFSCADTPAGGSYFYVVTAQYGSWSAPSAATATVTVLDQTAVSATAPASATTGTAIGSAAIAAALSGGATGAGGTITFKVFGPQASAPTTCTSGGTTVGTATVSGDATYHPSAGFTPATAGTYWWYASYGGDGADTAAASPCGSGMASTDVKNAPALTASGPATDATGTVIATSAITGVLSGAATGATGTITFTVFGPQTTAPTTCTSGGTTVGTATISANGTYHPSAAFTPATAGTYWWYASYGGDATDTTAASPCGTGMASTGVSNTTTLTATGPGTDTTGTAIAASAISATLAGAATGAAGTVTYKVFGPQPTAPTTCTTGGTTVGTATPAGNGTYQPSAGFTPSSAGDYWWYASYGGDANDSASASPCGGTMAETTVWTAAATGFATKVNSSTTSLATATVTLAPSTTYVLVIARQSATGDSILSITSSGLSPALTLSSFAAVKSQNYNTTSYEWTYDITTSSSASGSGTLTVTFAKSSSVGISYLGLVALAGNSTTTPVVTTNEAVKSGSSTTATANLLSAPASHNAELVALAGTANLGASAPTATGLTALSGSYLPSSSGSAGVYAGIPAQLNTTFSTFTSQPWGTVALELNHG